MDRVPNTIEQWMIDNRIACPEAGYPATDARWLDINDWLEWKVDRMITDRLDRRDREGY